MPWRRADRWADVGAVIVVGGGLLVAAAIAGGAGLVAVGLVAVVAALLWRPAGVARAARLAWRWGCLLAGTMALLVLVDWGIGAAVDAVLTDGGPTAGTGSPAVVDVSAQDLPAARDPRVASPALAGSPWADRYFAEMEAEPWTYVPYIGPREAPFRGRYINVANGVRRSYEPAGAGGSDAVEVWFFGGSTMWGEGQRDRHTIPSEVTRLAERDGWRLRPVNFGQRGYAAFAEFLLFEQELERRGPPDVVVFYDGINEIGTQTEFPVNLSRQPSIYQLDLTRRAFEREPAQPRAEHHPEPSVAREYLRTSALNQVLRGLAGMWDPQVAYAQGPGAMSPADRERAVENSAAIYRRSVDLIRHVAARGGLEPLLFWQPTVPRSENPDYYELTERVVDTPGLIDLSDSLEDVSEPVFIDSGHTNEHGARLVAEALWPHLKPVVREASRS